MVAKPAKKSQSVKSQALRKAYDTIVPQKTKGKGKAKYETWLKSLDTLTKQKLVERYTPLIGITPSSLNPDDRKALKAEYQAFKDDARKRKLYIPEWANADRPMDNKPVDWYLNLLPNEEVDEEEFEKDENNKHASIKKFENVDIITVYVGKMSGDSFYSKFRQIVKDHEEEYDAKYVSHHWTIILRGVKKPKQKKSKKSGRGN